MPPAAGRSRRGNRTCAARRVSAELRALLAPRAPLTGPQGSRPRVHAHMRRDALVVSALLLLMGAALQTRLWMRAVAAPAQPTPAPTPPVAAPSAPSQQGSSAALRPATMRYSRVSMPRERLRAVLHAGSLDLARLAADGGSIGAVQHAAVTHWPREEDCAALCRMEARTTERVPLTNTSHNTVSWLCLAFIWHAAPSNEGGGKCFLVGTPGSRGRSRAKRRRPPRPVPRPPLVPDAPPPPPMVPCAELLASTRTSGSTSASASTNASTSASASTNASRPSSASGPARRFVLVTSTARVGSNWVRSLLNQHPQLHMEGGSRS